MILAAIGAVVKQKFTGKSPYGIDSRHTFKVISHPSKTLTCRKSIIAILAQLVEHITRNDEVVGSIPTNGSTKKRTWANRPGPFLVMRHKREICNKLHVSVLILRLLCLSVPTSAITIIKQLQVLEVFPC